MIPWEEGSALIIVRTITVISVATTRSTFSAPDSPVALPHLMLTTAE